MSIDRTHRPKDGSAVGGYLISGLVRNVNKRNIEVMLDTSVGDILFENGEVTGVHVVTDEYNDSRTLNAKSVIVATGGFSANSQMVVKYRPDLEGFVTTNHKGATGGGIALLERIGAGTVDMGEIQIHPTVEQKTSYLISESIRGGGAILVNQKGKRFYNEMSTRDKVSAAIIALPEKYAYIVFDEHVRAKNKAADEYIAKGFVTSASSPKALAVKRSAWITTLSWRRWNVTTVSLKNSTMTTLVVPPRCVRPSMKGRSTPFRLRRACTTPWAA